MPADKKEELLVRVHTLVGFETKRKLDEMSKLRKQHVSFLIAIAIEAEFKKPYPFIYNVDIPEGDYEEYSFVDEAGKILTYMNRKGGASLEMLCNLRDDIGVPERDLFLLAFDDLLKKGFIEPYKPRLGPKSIVEYDKDFRFYRAKGTGHNSENRMKKDARRYEKEIKDRAEFERLKKKFEKN